MSETTNNCLSLGALALLCNEFQRGRNHYAFDICLASFVVSVGFGNQNGWRYQVPQSEHLQHLRSYTQCRQNSFTALCARKKRILPTDRCMACPVSCANPVRTDAYVSRRLNSLVFTANLRLHSAAIPTEDVSTVSRRRLKMGNAVAVVGIHLKDFYIMMMA